MAKEVTAKCPHCDALIEVDPEQEAANCQKCNKPFVVKKAIDSYNSDIGYVFSNTDNMDKAKCSEHDALIVKCIALAVSDDIKKEFEMFKGVPGITDMLQKKTDNVEIKLNYYNNSNKTISSVKMYVVPLNDNDEIVPSPNGEENELTVTINIQLAPYSLLIQENGYFYQETNWKNSSITKVRINRLVVHYQDGTMVSIPGDQVTYDSNISNNIDRSSDNDTNTIPEGSDEVIVKFCTSGYYDGVEWKNSNCVGGVSVKYNLYNNSNKTIKYIWMEVMPENAVGDVVSCSATGACARTITITGPIAQHTTSAKGNGYQYIPTVMWYNASISKIQINKLTIEYMDGTKLQIPGNKVTVNPNINSSSDSGSSGGCYIATSIYGSYDCPAVWTLRRYRDYSLAKSWYGRFFIHSYYAISPIVVKLFGDKRWFKSTGQKKLDRWVDRLQSKGYESTPYNDRIW